MSPPKEFRIRPSDSKAQILRQVLLLVLSATVDTSRCIKVVVIDGENNRGINSFACENPETIFKICDTFSGERLVIDKLIIRGCSENLSRFLPLISQLCQTNVFSAIEMDQESPSAALNIGVLEDSMAKVLATAISRSQAMQSLAIYTTRITRSSATILRQGLSQAQEGFAELILDAIGFEDTVTTTMGDESSVSILGSGIKENSTLKRISISTEFLADEDLPSLLEGLIGHESIEELKLELFYYNDSTSTSSRTFDQSLRTLAKVLSEDDCHIQSLDYLGPVNALVDQVLSLGDSIKSLKRLKLKQMYSVRPTRTGVDESFSCAHWFPKLLRNHLWKLSKLTHLDVSCPMIDTFPLLDESVLSLYSQSCRLERIDLDVPLLMNNVSSSISSKRLEEYQKALLAFLQHVPTLGCIGTHATTAAATSNLVVVTPQIQHYLDWNRCGGGPLSLLAQNEMAPPFPVELWPLVLERTNRLLLEQDQKECNVQKTTNDLTDGSITSFPDRRPNTIYHLFQLFFSRHASHLQPDYFRGDL